MDVVEVLLSNGAFINPVNDKGVTPLDLAAEDEDDGNAMDIDSSADEAPMTPSVERGRSSMERLLLRWQHMMDKVLDVDEFGMTMLHHATSSGDIKATRRALRYGAPVDQPDNAGWMPLHEACAKGHVEVVEELCRYGANVNAIASVPKSATITKPLEPDSSAVSSSSPKKDSLKAVGVTPLMNAAAGRFADVVKVLLQFGANPATKDALGRTALVYCEAKDVQGVESNSEPQSSARDIRELLSRGSASWEPFRVPEFIKTPHIVSGMMTNIRDSAANFRLGKHRRRNSVGSDSSLATNPTGSCVFFTIFFSAPFLFIFSSIWGMWRSYRSYR